ncbi:MAG: hypothetical protein A4E56_03279 [Pelotomaculum sp. PtaU1.Bin065]|nr:MAG: hypothetical protein A4E56_03279 [Pelotomaculum sp. PtaU1.Bin065]
MFISLPAVPEGRLTVPVMVLLLPGLGDGGGFVSGAGVGIFGGGVGGGGVSSGPVCCSTGTGGVIAGVFCSMALTRPSTQSWTACQICCCSGVSGAGGVGGAPGEVMDVAWPTDTVTGCPLPETTCTCPSITLVML